jgi:hypothetical protein
MNRRAAIAELQRQNAESQADIERRQLAEDPRDYIKRIEPLRYHQTGYLMEPTDEYRDMSGNGQATATVSKELEDVLVETLALCRRDCLNDTDKALVPIRQSIAKLEGKVDALMTLLQPKTKSGRV